MLAIDEITELSIRKKNGSVVMELKFSCKGGAEHNLIIMDDIESFDDDKRTSVIHGYDLGPIEAENGYLLYKYTYPLRHYLINLFGWK